MEFVKFETCPVEWDILISDFESKTIFHETSWHTHLCDALPNSEVLYFSIQENGKVIGYFCGHLVKKIFFNIMGSPLRGTGTNFMGPVVNSDINQSSLINAIEKMCQKEKIHHIELCNNILDKHIMNNAGFSVITRVTHLLNILSDKENMFMTLKSNCRNRVRKAVKNGLVVKIVHNCSIVDNFFEQFKEVYGKQGMAVPFKKARVASLFKRLDQRRLLSLVVKKEDKLLATGLFPYDNHTIYFWGATSWLKYQKLCPNELLHWEVIKFAISNKIQFYDMCGGGSRFKNKFGGDDVPFILYTKSYVKFLKYAMLIYKKTHFLKLKAKALFNINKYEKRNRIG